MRSPDSTEDDHTYVLVTRSGSSELEFGEDDDTLCVPESPDTQDDVCKPIAKMRDTKQFEFDEDDVLEAPGQWSNGKVSEDFRPPQKRITYHLNTTQPTQDPSCKDTVYVRDHLVGSLDRRSRLGSQKPSHIESNHTSFTVPAVLMYHQDGTVETIENATFDMDEIQEATPGIKMTQRYLNTPFQRWETKPATEVICTP